MAVKELPVLREKGVCCAIPDVDAAWAGTTAALMKALADPAPPHHGGRPLEGEVARLHLRFHRGARARAGDGVAPHGQAARGGTRRLREEGHLDVLLAAPPP